ncbi:MAG: hypothetical protein QME64_10875 [bacterium]|nr:hypothetical protein [bacterium]
MLRIWGKYRLEILLFLFLTFCYGYVWHKPSWNDLGRYNLMMAIVEQGTVCIDAYHQNTGDKAIFNGHYYSDKAPAPAFLGVPVYWLLNQLQAFLGLTELDHTLSIILWFAKLVLVRIFVISIPSALLGVFLYRFLLSLGTAKKYALFLTLGYSLGTLAFPYSTLFYGHQLAATFIFVSFYWLYRVRNRVGVENIQPLPQSIFLSGLFAGLAILTEYPIILLSAILLVYAILIRIPHSAFRNIFWFTVGLAIPSFILLYYNYLCSGNPFQFGYFQVAGEEFRREMVKGIAGVTYPKPNALFGITFSPYRGIFLINPILLLSIFGFYYFYKHQKERLEFWFCLIAVIVFLLFNASYYMWWGGWTIGPRHLIPIIPFLIIPIAFIPFEPLPNTAGAKYFKPYLLYTLTSASILFMFIGTVVDPQVPDTIRRLSWSPLFGYSLHQFLAGNFYANLGTAIGFTGLTSTLPLLIIIFLGILFLVRLSKSSA